MKKIIHVSDNFGGGLVTALQGYVVNTPQHQHYLLAAKRAGYHDAMEWARQFAGQFDLPSSVKQAPGAIRKIYNELQPDFLHLHSSFAGAYGRMAGIPREKVIYTPHCYAFERRDVNLAVRAGYWVVEQLLAARNATVAAASPREAALAQKMFAPQRVVLLPNVPVVPQEIFALRHAYQSGPRLRVAMVGRLAPQKDPGFFVETVRLVKARGLPIDFIWLGGGDDDWTRELNALDVGVTGWVSHREILAQMAHCDVYFHTAAWESGPLSVLEAAQLGLTMVCRSIPAIDSLPVQPAVPTAEAAAAMICDIAQGRMPAGISAINGVLNKKYSVPAQQTALAALYGA